MRILILVLLLTSRVLAQSAQDGSLAAARELYASADYRAALDMLDRLVTANPSPLDRQSIDLYRIFCFVALGRTANAEEAIASMIARDPLFRPADSDVPPRLRPMFSAKRKALLPTIVQSKYEQARAAFDRSDYKTAADGFTEMLLALSDRDIAGEASRPPLSELRVLAIGFNDLAVKAMVPRPVPTPAPAAPEPALPTPEAPAVVAPAVPRIYDSNDVDVVAPVTVRQEMPRFHRPVSKDRNGVLVVVIDESGRVEAATVTQSLDAYYDSMLVQAAKTWTYQPATRDGVEVKYRKRIQLTLPRQN